MQPKDVAENESAVLGSGEGLENMRLTSQVEFVWFLHKVQSLLVALSGLQVTQNTLLASIYSLQQHI